MYFDNFAELLSMDGYAVYVWPAYTITLLVLSYNQIMPILRKKRIVRHIKELENNATKECNQ